MVGPLQALLRGSLLVLAVLGAGGAVAAGTGSTVVSAALRLRTAVEQPGAAPEALSAVAVLLAAGALVVGWAWLVACLAACVAESVGHARGRAGARPPSALRPRMVRLLVGSVVGSAMALTAAPAGAMESGDRVDPIVVTGLLLPDRPTGRLPAVAAPTASSEPAVSPAVLEPPAADEAPDNGDLEGSGEAGTRSLTVTAGDSLWQLAEGLLPETATARDVDRAWRALHHANRATIGLDPDLIVPGTVLTVPGTVFDLDQPPNPTHRGDRP